MQCRFQPFSLLLREPLYSGDVFGLCVCMTLRIHQTVKHCADNDLTDGLYCVLSTIYVKFGNFENIFPQIPNIPQ